MRIQIPMRPRAMPRPRAKAGQQAYYPKPYQTWRDEMIVRLRQAKNEIGARTITEPVRIQIELSKESIDIEINEVVPARFGLTGDLDNYAKAINDCLQDAGIIEDDGAIDDLRVRFVDPQ